MSYVFGLNALLVRVLLFQGSFQLNNYAFSTLFAPIFGCDAEKKNKFVLFVAQIIIRKVDAGTAPSNGAIWDEFSEKHQHQSPISTFRVQIRYRIYADFSWAKLPRYSVTNAIWNSRWNYTCKVLYI